MSSISEGIPLTVIEAMAARRPVVATAVGGLPELVEHGVTGFLAASGDHASLATSLIELYRRPDLRKSMADVAARRAVEKFSLDGMLNGYRDVYREVLNHRHPRALPLEREVPRHDARAGAGGHS
jgi:glycosyltransferase involved in cell wall biosynthesis